MRHVVRLGGVVVLSCHLTFSAISNWAFDTSRYYLPTDSINYSCVTDRDTLTCRIFLKTDPEASNIDTNSDIILFTFTQLDNFSGESWQGDRGILADTDPLIGKFGCSPGCPGLAPGVYLIALSDRDETVTGSFKVTSIPDPYRTITGKVIVPAGAPAAFNSVSVSGQPSSLSGWTDSCGAYSIGIDRETIDRCNGKMTAFVESRFPGFISTPAVHRLDLSGNNWNEVNFSFIAATACVRGITLLDNRPIGDLRVALLDSAGSIVDQSTSSPDGAYILRCPAGTYRLAAHPVAIDQLRTVPGTIIVAPDTSLTHDIHLSMRDFASAPPTSTDMRGRGVLQLTIIDSTLAMVSKGVIMVWDFRAGSGISARPLRILPVQEINTRLSLMDIPDRPCCISVELTGSVMGRDYRYAAFAAERHGVRRIFDFSKDDTLQCAIIIKETDRLRATDGNGSVQGWVTASLPCPAQIAVLLYDIDRNSADRGCAIEADGSYRIDHIPAGAYRVIAVIDTNQDKTPDATAAADTVLTFTGAESYSGIAVAFSEKPSGTLRITGRIAGIGVIPCDMQLTVAALPVDTASQKTLTFDAMEFMRAYRAPVLNGGGFDIGDLPEGVYYVVAVAEKTDTASGLTSDVAFGIYGDVMLGHRGEAPFIPRPVVLDEDILQKPITISLIMSSGSETNPLIFGRKVTVPVEFALQAARIDASGTRVRVEFAIPQQTTVLISLDDIAGRTIAALPEATFAPGFHTITLNIDRRTTDSGTPIFAAMKSSAYKARQAVTPLEQPASGKKAASSQFPADKRGRLPGGSM